MIIPIISSISRELLKAVPDTQREAAYSLGATRWETLRIAVFPYVKSGLFGAAFLGLGRAVGETILVTMVIGNAVGVNAIPTSLFSQSQTLASVIANEFNEADIKFTSLSFNWVRRSITYHYNGYQYLWRATCIENGKG